MSITSVKAARTRKRVSAKRLETDETLYYKAITAAVRGVIFTQKQLSFLVSVT